MQRLLKVFILSLLIHFCFQYNISASTVVNSYALELDIESFQQKPKSKKAKADSAQVESPIGIMFRDLLEYLYFPGVPEEEKNKTNSGKKKPSSNQKKKN